MTQTNSQFIATSIQVANAVLILALEKEAEYKLTPYKLGKMVYMVYAWYYALTDKKLFQNLNLKNILLRLNLILILMIILDQFLVFRMNK